MKNCSLIVTLPRLIPNNKRLIEEIFDNENVSSVRLNTGVNQLLDNRKILSMLKSLSEKCKKIVWLDIKGRQLRINAWADSRYAEIELNHEIDIDYPAYIKFRNGTTNLIARTSGSKILLANPPKEALGKGQSININAKRLDIKGYLTDNDKELLRLSYEFELNYIMASFVEQMNDLIDILLLNPNSTIVSKIESMKGIKFMLENPNLLLMAARDDLYIENGEGVNILDILKTIVKRDKNAICASKIFDSLEHSNTISLQDYEDLELMYLYGYRNYMIGDNISNYNISLALKKWKEFINE